MSRYTIIGRQSVPQNRIEPAIIIFRLFGIGLNYGHVIINAKYFDIEGKVGIEVLGNKFHLKNFDIGTGTYPGTAAIIEREFNGDTISVSYIDESYYDRLVVNANGGIAMNIKLIPRVSLSGTLNYYQGLRKLYKGDFDMQYAGYVYKANMESYGSFWEYGAGIKYNFNFSRHAKNPKNNFYNSTLE